MVPIGPQPGKLIQRGVPLSYLPGLRGVVELVRMGTAADRSEVFATFLKILNNCYNLIIAKYFRQLGIRMSEDRCD